jgi:hypothetical protein
MQRLALLAAGEAAPVESAAAATPRRARRRDGRWSTLVCFGLGALASSVLGGVILLGLSTLNASEARMHRDGPAGPRRAAAPQIVDVAVERSERAHTALSLRVEGAGNADAVVVLRGVPAEARLSKGRRRDAQTWVVESADLDGLSVTLGATGPDAFDMRVDVLAESGAAAEAGIVRVRVVDAPAQKRADAGAAVERPPNEASPVGTRDAAGAAETSVAKLAPAVARHGGPDAAAVARAKVARPPARADAKPAARHWPEGASGLGATQRSSERQLWWSMPPPSWSPFDSD